MKNPLGIKLDGCVYSLNEEKGWCFGGELSQIDEEGNHVINIE